MTELQDRLEAKIEFAASGCWNWAGPKDTCGYGHFSAFGKHHRAHRRSYETYRGRIPKGMVVCHRCDNPPCVNPAHLFVGTQADNMADMKAKGRQPHTSMKGITHGCVKLSEEEVLAIRAATGLTQFELAAKYQISQQQVSNIRTGKKWTHLVQVVGS